MEKKKRPTKDPLIGKYFHTLKDGKLHNQGQFMAKVSEGYYTVDFFSFMTGFCTLQKVASVADMKDWMIYETREDMEHSYQFGIASRIKG